MSDIYIKTATQGWKTATNIFVKTATQGWKSAIGVFLKRSTGWLRVWPISGVFATRSAWVGANSNTTYENRMPYSASPAIRIGSNYYGNNAIWDANGWTISSYTYAWRYYSNSDASDTGTTFTGESGTGSGWTASGTGQDALPLSTWNNSTLNNTYDRKYARFEVTANATNSTYSGTSRSNIIPIVRRSPSNLSINLSSTTPTVGTAISLSSSWDTTEAYKPEAARTTVRWYRNSTNVATGGVLVQDSNAATPYSYTPTSSDIGNYLYVIEETFNSGSDFDNNSTLIGVKASVVSANTVANVNAQATGQQRRIQLPSSFTKGTKIYVSTNGYINWGGNDPGGGVALPNSGITLAPLAADLRQGSTTTAANQSIGGLWTKSDANNFWVTWHGNYYTQGGELARYQVKFYWDQSYADVYFVANSLTTGIPSTTAVKNNAAVFKTWSESTTQPSTIESTSSMTKYTTQDGQDDQRTELYADVLASPTSLSATNNDKTKITLTHSGGGANEFYFYYTANSATRPDDTTTFADFVSSNRSTVDWIPLSRGVTYYFFARSREGFPTYKHSTSWYPALAPGASGRSPLYAPGTPTSLSATVQSSTQINLSWTAPATSSTVDAASGYDIYYSTTNSAPTSFTSATTTSTTNSKSITGLTANTTYYFWVRATNVDNTGSSASAWTSPSVSATTQQALSTPTSLTATSNDSTKITLTWSGGAGDNYIVWYGNSTSATPPSSSSTQIEVGSGSTYNWTTMARGNNYYFFIKARNGTSPNFTYSSTWYPSSGAGIFGRAPFYKPGVPGSPSAAKDSTNPSSRINFSWTAPTTNSTQDAAEEYDIYYSTSSSAPTSSTTPSTSTTNTSQLFISLSASTTYYFWVRSKNADNFGSNASAWTTAVSATTDAAPVAPSGGVAGTPTLTSFPGTDGRVGAVYAANITTEASGTPTPTKSYQWQYFRNSNSTWTDISGATSSSYTIPYSATSATEGTIAMPGRIIRCRVTWTNTAGSQSSDGNSVSISPPTITGITATLSATSPFIVYRCYGYNFQSIASRNSYGSTTPPGTTDTNYTYSQAGNSTIPITRQSGNGGANFYYSLEVIPYSTVGTGIAPVAPVSIGLTRFSNIVRNTTTNQNNSPINVYGTGSA